MDAKAIWKQNGLKFLGTANSGAEVGMASSMDEGEVGFRPMELLGVGLAGCTGMDVISILKKKREDIIDLEVHVHTESAEEYPRIWTEVQLEYIITGRNVSPQAVERAIQLSAEKYCPAQNIINKSVDIETSYKIIEVGEG